MCHSRKRKWTQRLLQKIDVDTLFQWPAAELNFNVLVVLTGIKLSFEMQRWAAACGPSHSQRPSIRSEWTIRTPLLSFIRFRLKLDLDNPVRWVWSTCFNICGAPCRSGSTCFIRPFPKPHEEKIKLDPRPKKKNHTSGHEQNTQVENFNWLTICWEHDAQKSTETNTNPLRAGFNVTPKIKAKDRSHGLIQLHEHHKPSCDCTYGCAILEELDHLTGLQVPPHTTRSDKDTNELKTREDSVRKDQERTTVCGRHMEIPSTLVGLLLPLHRTCCHFHLQQSRCDWVTITCAS